jgi:hypothetical protein
MAWEVKNIASIKMTLLRVEDMVIILPDPSNEDQPAVVQMLAWHTKFNV